MVGAITPPMVIVLVRAVGSFVRGLWGGVRWMWNLILWLGPISRTGGTRTTIALQALQSPLQRVSIAPEYKD